MQKSAGSLLFRGTVCRVRRTLARSAFHGFSIGFQRCKSWNPLSFSVAQKLESRVKKSNYANPSILKDQFSEIVFIQTFLTNRHFTVHRSHVHTQIQSFSAKATNPQPWGLSSGAAPLADRADLRPICLVLSSQALAAMSDLLMPILFWNIDQW